MIVTEEILEKYDACEAGLKYFRENYPQGADTSELLKDKNISKEFLHFGAKYLDITLEERKKYYELCNVINSKYVLFSENIKNSKGISYSDGVEDSEYIKRSTDIKKSSFVYFSTNVDNGSNIDHSETVIDSYLVVDSKRVFDSHSILKAEEINWSNNLSYCSNTEDSSFCYLSKNLVDCHFCGAMEKSSHCLFCFGLSNEEYCIFNKSVSPMVYEAFKDELMATLEGEAEAESFITVHKGHTSKRFEFSNRPDAIFSKLSEDFFGKVGNYINFDADLFLKIFFKDAN